MLKQIARIAANCEHRFADGSKHFTTPPTCYESITPEWLTSLLCAEHPAVAVTGYRVVPSHDIVGKRKRIHVEYGEQREGTLPAFLFCKFTHGAWSAAISETLGTSGSEVLFYATVRKHLDIETPRCVFSRFDPTYPSSIVILQDLEHIATEFCTHTTTITRDRAEAQLDTLAELHSKCHEGNWLYPRLHDFPSWPEYFFRWDTLGIQDDVKRGLFAAKDMIPARLFGMLTQVWPATIASVERHARLPQTLLHNDLQLKNWYVTADGAMGLCDWETTVRGHWSRDITHAVVTSLTVDNRRAWERDLLLYYLDRMKAGGVSIGTFDEAWTNYRQQMVAALVFWTLILGAETEYGQEAGDVTLELVRRAATAVDDLDSLSSF